jgi:nicotinamidase/pyrazinamidase
MKKALIVVDIQNDFLPGGRLAVPDGDKIIPKVNDLIKKFDLVIATQDWHPANHISFAENHKGKKPGDKITVEGVEQILWPLHCVQNTFGAEFAKDLLKDKFTAVIRKGTDPMIDSYSGFFDNARKKDTGLDNLLKSLNVSEVYIVGLATDYCVKFTALDAVSLGYKTHVIRDACMGVNLKPNDTENALNELKKAGVIIE